VTLTHDISLPAHALALLGGLVAGTIDAIAGGGGLITVPTLLAIGLPPHLALGTNKVQSTIGVAVAMLRYRQGGLVRLRDWKRAIVFTALGAAAGTALIQRLSPGLLAWLIPVLLVAILFYTLLTPGLGERARPERVKPAVLQPVAGTVLGFHDGFFGPGTGTFWAMTLVGLGGLDLRKATGATKVMNFTSNLVAAVLFLVAGQIVVTVALAMTVGQVAGSLIGSHLVLSRPPRFIRWVLVVSVTATAARLLWRQFTGQ